MGTQSRVALTAALAALTTDRMSNVDPKLLALHIHWLRADSIKEFITAVPKAKPGDEQFSPELLAAGQHWSSFHRLCVWYALLNVVVEGYREVGIEDPTIEALLAEEDRVKLLRRFRNAVFHYQKDPISEKMLAFLDAHGTEHWPRKLNRAFDEFFQRELPIHETLDRYRSE